MIHTRRKFLTGLGSLLAAPAIVHAGNLMPVKAINSDRSWAVCRSYFRWDSVHVEMDWKVAMSICNEQGSFSPVILPSQINLFEALRKAT